MRKLQVLLVLLSCFGAVGASAENARRTVALLLAAPEVTSLLELAGKSVAIDEVAASNDEAQRKVETMVGVKMAGGRGTALDRLANGEVPAAVLTLDYPETAEWSAEIAGFKVFRIPLADRPEMVALAPADPAAPETRPANVPASSEARAEVTDPAAESAAKKVREQMRVATVIAEHVMTLRDAEKKAASSPNIGEPSVAIVVARPEIKSISDLTGKIIAIDDRYSNANARIHAAIASAGATDSLLASSESMAMDRLLSGKTPAAVLTLVYPETGFSTIEGYSVFRVPLAGAQPSR